MYLGPEAGPVSLIAHNESATETYWTYTLTGSDDVWSPGETLVLEVKNPAGAFPEGNYRLRLALYNGATGEQAYSI